MNKQKGFTLVELLVVIAIVGILAGALLIAINPQAMVQKSRDSKRLQDLDSLVKALNLALTDGEATLNAAGTGNSGTGSRDLDGTGWVAYTVPTGKTGLSKFIPTLPVDPVNATQNGTDYVYTFGSNATDFEVDAVLEHTDNGVKMSTDGGDNDARYEVGTSLTVLN